MLDIVMLALGLGFFAADRLRLCLRTALTEQSHDLRLFPRRPRLAGLLFYLTYALLRPERF